MSFEEQRADIIQRSIKSARIPVLMCKSYSAVLGDCGRVELFGPDTPGIGWDWQDIVSLAGTEKYMIGLKADGTVEHSPFTPGIVSNFTDIIMVAAGDSCVAGLKMNGKVVVTGEKSNGEYDASKWESIVSIVAGNNYIMGLRDDGTVFSTSRFHDLSEWKNIVSIVNGFGLTSDGKVVAINTVYRKQVSTWENIIQISTGVDIVAGLQSDGTVVTVGVEDGYIVKSDWHSISRWKNIKHIYAGNRSLIGIDVNGNIFYETNYEHDGFKEQLGDIEKFTPKSKTFLGLIMFETEQTEKRKPEMEQYIKEFEMRIRRRYGSCQHCGGKFAGLFIKKCSNCGLKKDY